MAGEFILVTAEAAQRRVGITIFGTATPNLQINVYRNGVYANYIITAANNTGNWSFVPDQAGTWNFELTVSGGNIFSNDVIVLPTTNSVPVPGVTATQIGNKIPGTSLNKGSILVYINDILADQIPESSVTGSTNNWQADTPVAGSYTFAVTNSNGLSARSAAVIVSGTIARTYVNGTKLGAWPGNNNREYFAVSFDNGVTFNFLGKISDNPLEYEPRVLGFIQADDFVVGNGHVENDLVGSLSGVYGARGSYEIDYTLLMNPPAGWVRKQETTIVKLATAIQKIEVQVTEFCGETAAGLQTGITNEYGDVAPASTTVTSWKDGLKVDVEVQNGKWPWVFVRKKNEPTNVSLPTRTVLS